MRKSWLMALAFLPQSVLAIPFEFSFTTTIASSAIADVSTGDILTFRVIADNGSSSLNSQTWLVEDVASAQTSVGSYVADYFAPFFPSVFAFQTNSLGEVSAVNFGDIDGSNQDIYGSGGMVAIGSDAIRDFYGNLAIFSGCVVPPGTGPNCKDDVRLWDVKPINEVPEPAPWLILSLGLAALGVQRKLAMAKR